MKKRFWFILCLTLAIITLCSCIDTSDCPEETLFIKQDIDEFVSAWKNGEIFKGKKEFDPINNSPLFVATPTDEQYVIYLAIADGYGGYRYKFKNDKNAELNISISGLSDSFAKTVNRLSLTVTDGVAYDLKNSDIYLEHEGREVCIDFPNSTKLVEGDISKYVNIQIIPLP